MYSALTAAITQSTADSSLISHLNLIHVRYLINGFRQAEAAYCTTSEHESIVYNNVDRPEIDQLVIT